MCTGMACSVAGTLKVPSSRESTWSERRSACAKGRRRVSMRPPKAAAEEHVDRRIHYHSNSEEGWVGRPSTPSYPETSADARALQRPSSGLIKLLLEMPDTHYKFLELNPDAGPEEVKSAYRRLSKKYHPDTTALPIEVAAAKFLQLKEAHRVLSSREERRVYDWQLASQSSKTQGTGYVWPYESDRSQRGVGSQPKSNSSQTDDGTIKLSDQAVSALAFDAFAFIFAIGTIIYVAFFKNK